MLSLESSDNISVKVIQEAQPNGSNWVFKNEKETSVFSTKLGEVFELNQGVVPNPDKVTKRNISKINSSVKIGEGIFTLTKNEVDLLRLKAVDKKLVKPTISNSEIYNYVCKKSKDEYLLYITDDTSITKESSIYTHLSRYKTYLKDRREVKLGRRNWTSLHWPRNKEIFETPKILVSNWGSKSRNFALELEGYYCKRDVTILNPKKNIGDLIYIYAIFLNSNYAIEWFSKNTIIKGYTRQSSQLNLPLPSVKEVRSNPLYKKIINLGKSLYSEKRAILTKNERKLVDEFYNLFTLSEAKSKLAS